MAMTLEPKPYHSNGGILNSQGLRSNVKVLLTVFFDCNSVVDHEFLPQGRTVNKEYYLKVMQRLREEIHWKSTELWKNPAWSDEESHQCLCV